MIILFTDSLPKIHRFFVKKWLGTSNLLCVHFKFFIAKQMSLTLLLSPCYIAYILYVEYSSFLAKSNVRRFNNQSMLQSICGEDASVSSEVSKFILSGSTVKWDMSYFDIYPNVKRVFLKYNSIHTSEADIERVFSYAGKSLRFIFHVHMGHVGLLQLCLFILVFDFCLVLRSFSLVHTHYN